DPPDELELAADTGAGPEEEVVGALSVEQALEKLKPVYRQIITMKVLADMTFKEIASVLDMPMGTVTWNYREAIKQLRRFGYD
ncbi:MAG: sigma-70 family RNA polymerase sigma factor, partial [Lachnospiraceae bacterium]|nr:sigma-70 family RNA polymerase sigma factor [Lachnospiraceae bacterium]